MTAPILAGLERFCGIGRERVKNEQETHSGKLGLFGKIRLTTILFDTAVSISALVLGILGLVSIIHMSHIVSYTLMGVTGTISLGWIITAIITKGKCFQYSAQHILAAFSRVPTEAKA